MNKNILVLVALFFASYLFTIVLDLGGMNPFLKPLLIPSLLVFVLLSDLKMNRTLLIAALIFSTFGDIFLLFKQELFFILGLGSFLTAHVLYIFIFRKLTAKFPPTGVVFVVLVVLGVYLGFFLSYLWPNLKEMKIPVVVYALTISTMLWMAVSNWYSTRHKSNLIIVLGAFLFVISDSILAIDLFHHPIENGRFLVMFTYLSAQLAIVYGLVKGEMAVIKGT
jgi:uncharacterized membrane protein YhhN